MGLSNRKFADLAGVSESAVRKARTERIVGAILPDGTLDPDKALALWGRNTDPSMQRKLAPITDVADTLEPTPIHTTASGGTAKARDLLIVEKALRERIKRKKDEESVIERAPTAAMVQTLAREFRDGFMGFPDKYHSQIAAELDVDPETGKVDAHSV
jgi:hypothetical protein